MTKVDDDDKVSIMRFKKKTKYLMDDDPDNLGSSKSQTINSVINSGGSRTPKV